MAQALDVGVDSGFGELLFLMPLLAVAPNQSFCDPADFDGREKRQEDFEPIAVPLLGRSLVEKPAREFRKEHLGFQVGKLRRFEANFFLVLLVDLLCKPAVTGSRRACMADAIFPDVAPVHVAALEETHFLTTSLPFWRFKIHSTTCLWKKTNLPRALALMWGSPSGKYRCRTVQTEQPRSPATSSMSIGSPRREAG